METGALISIIETPEFLAKAADLFTADEKTALLSAIAANPEAGDLIVRSGGFRKLRWGMQGHGKRGGARVVYFFHNVGMPVFMITAYPKNQKENLSDAEVNALRSYADTLVNSLKAKSNVRNLR